MRVSEARRGDIDKLGDFILKSWEEAGPGALGWTGATEKQVHHVSSREFLASLLDDEETRIFLAWKDDEIVGFAATEKISQKKVELSGIVVREDETGKGVGSQLLEFSMRTSVKDGYETMIVKTESHNTRAIGFYEKHGFESIETRVEQVVDTPVELVVLARSL